MRAHDHDALVCGYPGKRVLQFENLIEAFLEFLQLRMDAFLNFLQPCDRSVSAAGRLTHNVPIPPWVL